jgi:hypothetical protein
MRAAATLFASVLVVLAAAAAARAGVPAGTFHGCPAHVLPLPTSYEPALDRIVLHFVHDPLAARSKDPSYVDGARVTGRILVRRWLPSGWIKDECGRLVWERSVAVSVYFPKLDLPHNPVGHCNECAVSLLIASWTARGWTVWGIY